MRLALQDARAGSRRRLAVCPGCGSERVRPSRRHYDGLWFRVFQVRPVTCTECSLCFPVAVIGAPRNPPIGTLDLNLPFRPLELEDSERMAEDLQARSGPDGSVLGRKGFLGCPVCGSGAVHVGRTGPDGDWRRLFEVEVDHRCLECNAGFKRISPMRFVILAGVLVSVLGGLSYVVIATLDPVRTKKKVPTIRKNEIPPPPPPVFRKRLGVEAATLTVSAG